MRTNKNTSLVIFSEKKKRYFYAFKRGRCYTAWSLAGAKQFLLDDPDRFRAVFRSMERRGLKPKSMLIGEINAL